MRLAWIIFCIGLACASGCTTGRLRQRTVNQGSTLPELQYQQVLGNLATFATNPAVLPWHVNLREGTTQITDSATAGALVDLGPPAVTQPQIFGSRTAVAQWGMAPVIDPTELKLLRIAYRRACAADIRRAELLDELAHELKEQIASNTDLRNESELFYELREPRSPTSLAQFEDRAITTNDDRLLQPDRRTGRPRAFAAGARTSAARSSRSSATSSGSSPAGSTSGAAATCPRTACYVGKNGDCYVWVNPDGCEALTEFTLTVLKLSTLIKETQTLINPGNGEILPRRPRRLISEARTLAPRSLKPPSPIPPSATA